MRIHENCNVMYSRFVHASKQLGIFDVINGHEWLPVNVLNNTNHEFGKAYVMKYHSTKWGRNGNIGQNSYTASEASHIEWFNGYESSEVISHLRISKGKSGSSVVFQTIRCQ